MTRRFRPGYRVTHPGEEAESPRGLDPRRRRDDRVEELVAEPPTIPTPKESR